MLFIKMGDTSINCPLCCNETFNSKLSLIEHLSNTLSNLYCPICNNKWSSVVHLLEHLSLDNCRPDKPSTIQSLVFENDSNGINDLPKNISLQIQDEQNENLTHTVIENHYNQNLDTVDESSEVSKMYVELLNKQFTKSCLQAQDLKLAKAEEDNKYIIITQQNDDCTISLTPIKTADLKLESETLIAPTEREQEDSQEELYSCNTCGVSFSSVLEHIQNYHTDQEVVVEEPMEETGQEAEPVDALSSENNSIPKLEPTSRRVITETGDIIEGPMIIKTGSLEDELIVPDGHEMIFKEEEAVQGSKNIKPTVKIPIETTKQTSDKNGKYHKVVLKEMEVAGSSRDKVKMYHCLVCNIYVSHLNQFKLQPCVTPPVKYQCPHCPMIYENSKSLCAHMKVHKPKPDLSVDQVLAELPPASYDCEICNTVFPSNKSLKLHKRMHDPVKSRPIEPPVENTDGSEVSEGRYRCNVCGKMIPIDYRTIHQNSHKTSNKMNCSICNKKFQSMEYLEMHMNVHNLDKAPVNKQNKSLPYNCLYCNRMFARPHEKVKHERIHTGEKPHSCEICGKSFRVSYCLTLHMRTHTGARPYACTICGKRFKAHSVYNHHLLTHSEVRAYKCPFCPKAFKTSVQLAGHKNSHTKPFSCQHCNRPFASLYAVRVHTETHARLNNLKFSCSLCGASYARAFALKDHVRTQHHRLDPDLVVAVKKEDWMTNENGKDETTPTETHNKSLPSEARSAILLCRTP